MNDLKPNHAAQEQALVKLSAENLLLRQRVAQYERENKQLRESLGDRTKIIDRINVYVRGERREQRNNGLARRS